jgi:hypothetical protein
VSGKDIEQFIGELGAIEFLSVCAVALERQAGRLKAARPPDPTGMQSFYELTPDVWFAVVALHRSFTVLDLAAKVSTMHATEIRTLARTLPNRRGVKRVRDVYEHFDDYFQFKGKLQKVEAERPDMHLPQVGLQSGPGGVTSVTVAIGKQEVDVLDTIQVIIPTLLRARDLLEDDHNPG